MSLSPGCITMPVLASDPVLTPSSGKVFYYIVGNELRYKDSAGSVYSVTLNAESIQDVIGNILTDTSTIDFVYDDPNNQIKANVIPGGISHQDLSGAGSNTHAQIDSHISSASNPHGVTAAQAGAVPTGRLISSGTGLQGGGDLSADRTLNLTNTGVSAGVYTIPTVTIDAQGRITSASNGSLPVTGQNYQNFVDSSPFSTNSSTNQTAASFTTSSCPAGTYRVGMKFNFTTNSTNSSSFFGMYVDGNLIDAVMQVELKDASDDITYYTYAPVVFASSGTRQIQLRVRTENGMTVTVNLVRVEFWRTE